MNVEPTAVATGIAGAIAIGAFAERLVLEWRRDGDSTHLCPLCHSPPDGWTTDDDEGETFLRDDPADVSDEAARRLRDHHTDDEGGDRP